MKKMVKKRDSFLLNVISALIVVAALGIIWADAVAHPNLFMVSPNNDTFFNITINNTNLGDAIGNITIVNITLRGMDFVVGSNGSNAPWVNFTYNATLRELSWSNNTPGGYLSIGGQNNTYFWFKATILNASAPGFPYTYFNITVKTLNYSRVEWDEMNITIKVNDSNKPSIVAFQGITPGNGSNVTFIFINVTATDNANISAFRFKLFNSTRGLINDTNVTVYGKPTDTASVNYTQIAASLANGFYYFNVTVNDSNGNLNSTETLRINLNTERPIITLISPTNGNNTLTSETITFVFNVSDFSFSTVSCNLTLNGMVISALGKTIVNITDGVNNSFINRTFVVNNTWNITCIDSSNNLANSSTFNFLIPNFAFNGIAYDVDGNALNNSNISILIRDMTSWSQVDTVSTLSNISGGFNFSVFANSSHGYQVSVTHINASTNAVDFVGQSLPTLPYNQVIALNNINFYLQEAGTINVTVRNSTEVQTNGFAVQIKDTKLGYPVSCTGFTPSSGDNYLCYVPKNRNYSIMIYPSQGSTERFVPVSFSFGSGATNFSSSTTYNLTDRNGANLSWYNHTKFTLNKQFNITQQFAQIFGYINYTSAGRIRWGNFTIVPFLLEPGNMVFMDYGTLPFNISSWRGGGESDVYNNITGFYNISVSYAPAETTSYLFLALANNASNTNVYYGSYQNISVSGNKGLNFTMYGLLGSTSRVNMTNISGATVIINTNRQSFNLVNTSNSILSSVAAHIELSVDYSIYNSTLPAFTFMSDLNGQGAATFSFPLLNVTGIHEMNIFSQTYAPKRVPTKTTSEITANPNITLSSFNPGAIDGSIATSGISISLYKSNSTCDVPNPSNSCLLTSSSSLANFNPISVVMGGGKISFRMGTSSGIFVHYVNVDMLASGPPDAAFDNEAGGSESSTTFSNAIRFGSSGPTIYDYVLISMPYSEAVGSGLDDSAAVSMSIPKLYDDNWNIIWDTSTNGTNITSLANNFSHYSTYIGDWIILSTSRTCLTANVTSNKGINSTYPCYIDNSSNRIWIRLPHFSGAGPDVDGGLIPSPSTATTGGGSAYATETNLATGYTKKYYAGDATTFKINGKLHTFIMLYIKNNTATVQISSTSQKATLAIGEEKKFDVDGDGKYYDFSVKLNAITGIQADITLKNINESVSAETAETEGTGAETAAEGGTMGEGTGATEKAAVLTIISWIIIAVIVVIVIALIVWYAMKKK
jgi:hypothetical protein